MRRDRDLIRELLFVIEREAGPRQVMASDIQIPGRDPEQIVAHVGMLDSAGFIEGQREDSLDPGEGEYIIDRLT